MNKTIRTLEIIQMIAVPMLLLFMIRDLYIGDMQWFVIDSVVFIMNLIGLFTQNEVAREWYINLRSSSK